MHENVRMRLRFWLGFAVAAAIAIGSLTIALVVRQREDDNFQRMQRDEATRSARQAEALAALSVGQLDTAAAIFQSEGRLSKHEFDVMADSLLRGGALSAAAFVQAVPASDRARFERRHGFPIVERSRLGDLRRARPRPEYFPLVFASVDHRLPVTIPLGYDVGSDQFRVSNLLQARDTGRLSATPVIRLAVGGTGITVFRPVYANGEPTGTVAQRRAALIGFSTGSFRVPDLASAATTALPDGVDVELVDRGRTVIGPDLPRDDTATAMIKIADRSWLLVVRDPGRPGVSLPLLIAGVGISLAALLGALVLIWSRNERMQELQRQASQDALTGLNNRRRFEENLHRELARSRREGTEGALLILDLDNFKRVNDTLGHRIGDAVIGEVAGVLRRRTRETDVLARLGGDEFAIVLPRCHLEEAQGVAEAISTAVREHALREEGVDRITASIGIAMFGGEPPVGFEAVLAQADAAMYAAKAAGRNAVRVAGAGADMRSESGELA
jgi:diguanylate cyclase (GGDEF)-like protein